MEHIDDKEFMVILGRCLSKTAKLPLRFKLKGKIKVKWDGAVARTEHVFKRPEITFQDGNNKEFAIVIKRNDDEWFNSIVEYKYTKKTNNGLEIKYPGLRPHITISLVY